MSSLSRAQSWPLLSGAAPAEDARNIKAKSSQHFQCRPQIQARRLLCRHYYPEGGWGWVVAVCAVLVHIVNHGFQISCSQLVSPAAFKFHVPKSYPAGAVFVIP
ncbi:uncharacterized protein LOC108903299 [Anoplophora glabripennis]|uniref:uncharacterized protein LOC108903299 n=1 Tax=Anoplophora glabripennis TaxID=217634 RepID=UPI000874575F|nr:uncharacterized protein LOC108903299 [Anoplophora glabripennis]